MHPVLGQLTRSGIILASLVQVGLAPHAFQAAAFASPPVCPVRFSSATKAARANTGSTLASGATERWRACHKH